MNKFKTQIPGLDMLFHGGIQIDNSFDETCNNSNNDKGLVVVIRGAKGTHKTTLALQLMNGLCQSMMSAYKKKCKEEKEEINALFYSINKNTRDLNDSFLDIIISQLFKDIIRQYRLDIFHNNGECDDINYSEDIQAIIEFLFDFKKSQSDNLQQIIKNLPRLICEGIVIYNQRTNALHYKRGFTNDDLDNLIAPRKYDTIQEYISAYKVSTNKCLDSCKHEIIKKFLSHMVSVLFNADEKGSLNMDTPKNPMTFYRAIEMDIYEKNFRLKHPSNKTTSEQPKISETIDEKLQEAIINKECKYDVLVIDGFSQLNDNDSKNLPYSNLTDQAKRLAKVSILVFDEREEARCDGDIVIDLHDRTDEAEEYMYNELRITKSVFQTAVLGWHQYKKRDEGIEVFPSVHLLLSKRFYVHNKYQTIGQSLYETNYDQFLEVKNFKDSIEGKNSISQTPFEEYLNQYRTWKESVQTHIFENYLQNMKIISKEDKSKVLDVYDELRSILFFNKIEDEYSRICIGNSSNDTTDLNKPGTDHFPSTVIIGNPNSYKRTLALATSYRLAQQGIHTLFFLFDKDELEMRQHMVCPAFNNGNCMHNISECMKCGRYIHTYDVRMGCISAEEFFSILLDQINFYCSPDTQTGIETKSFHIVIDDLQKIDFSFPFLKATDLFLSALLAICHNHNVKLTILCDKSAKLTHEASSLVDTVIDIRRETKDIYNIELNVERGGNKYIPSRIMQYKISKILHAFSCDGSTMSIQEHNVLGKEIGSMKEYWRQTYNQVSKGESSPETN